MNSHHRTASIGGTLILLGALISMNLPPVTLAGGVHASASNPGTVLYFPLMANRYFPPAFVSLQNTAFVPKSLIVHVGTPVTWTNNESNSLIHHTVTSGIPGTPSGGIFDSPVLAQGQSFQFTFTSTGTYAYYCRIHGSAMTGSVVVLP
jgi:plastocyanin